MPLEILKLPHTCAECPLSPAMRDALPPEQTSFQNSQGPRTRDDTWSEILNARLPPSSQLRIKETHTESIAAYMLRCPQNKASNTTCMDYLRQPLLEHVSAPLLQDRSGQLDALHSVELSALKKHREVLEHRRRGSGHRWKLVETLDSRRRAQKPCGSQDKIMQYLMTATVTTIMIALDRTQLVSDHRCGKPKPKNIAAATCHRLTSKQAKYKCVSTQRPTHRNHSKNGHHGLLGYTMPRHRNRST